MFHIYIDTGYIRNIYGLLRANVRLNLNAVTNKRWSDDGVKRGKRNIFVCVAIFR